MARRQTFSKLVGRHLLPRFECELFIGGAPTVRSTPAIDLQQQIHSALHAVEKAMSSVNSPVVLARHAIDYGGRTSTVGIWDNDILITEIRENLKQDLSTLSKVQKRELIAASAGILQTSLGAHSAMQDRSLEELEKRAPGASEAVLQLAERVLEANVAVSREAIRRNDRYRYINLLVSSVIFVGAFGSALYLAYLVK